MTTTPETDLAPTSAEIVSKRRDNPLLGQRGFEFDLNSAIRFATGLCDSGMAPKGMKAGAVVAILEAGKELGLAPMFALGNLTLVNGRLGIMGDAAKALIRASGVLKDGTDFSEEWTGEEFADDRKCTVTAWRAGQPAPFSRSFTIKEAKRGGLVRVWTFPEGQRKGEREYQSAEREGAWGVKGPWATYTDRMLMYRALGFLCRDYFSDVMAGAVLAEEFADYPKAALGSSKEELVKRFMPDAQTVAQAIDFAAPYAPAEMLMRPEECPHTAGPRTKQTYEGPDEPPSLSEVCAGCDTPWSQCQPKGGE